MSTAMTHPGRMLIVVAVALLSMVAVAGPADAGESISYDGWVAHTDGSQWLNACNMHGYAWNAGYAQLRLRDGSIQTQSAPRAFDNCSGSYIGGEPISIRACNGAGACSGWRTVR